MTPKEKQLLFKDLCARLPYHFICNVGGHLNRITDVHLTDFMVELSYPININGKGAEEYKLPIQYVKPYLRPMSSMTEEEEEYALCTWGDETLCNGIDLLYDNYMMFGCAWEFIDWLNEHHFDYHGLIEKGLALEAPEGMYKTE